MSSFYIKIAAAFSAILVGFGLLVIFITLNASADIARETIQFTNKNLAATLAEDVEPVVADSFDHETIQAKLTELSGKNPQFDFYLLDRNGMIKSAIPATEQLIDIENRRVDTAPLDAFIAGRKLPLLGTDPLNPDRKKPFSAAPISIMGSSGCYLYVVLEGEQFTQTAALISNSYILRGSLMLIGLVMLISLVTGLFIFSNITSRLKKIKKTVSAFERGQLNERIQPEGNDELTELSVCFNRMADNLVENMKEIRKTDRLRRELIANVSHDLRSPIASIQGYLETIQMKKDSISQQELESYIRTVISNTQKLNRLIEDLFSLSRLDAEEITPEPEFISMPELLQDLVHQFKPIATAKGVSLSAVFPEQTGTRVKADIALMNRALTNLVDNAIRHTPEGGSVTITSTHSGKDVIVEVCDTGSGIPESDLPFIFDRFYQIDKSRSGNHGSGLGLAIARKIFNLHGAELNVTSSLNKGTTFRISLPAVLR